MGVAKSRSCNKLTEFSSLQEATVEAWKEACSMRQATFAPKLAGTRLRQVRG